MVRDAVTAKDIAEVVGRMTGIPVSVGEAHLSAALFLTVE
jgi:ATP-dependent Clp protease ATP-binding subunit ClpA